MELDVIWSPDVHAKFPELAICIGAVTGIWVEEDNEHLRQLKRVVYEEIERNYSVEALKDNPTVRAYRDFYWRLDIDPTKTRPSGEALLRRVLNGNELPSISTVVDAYNLASTQTIIPISGFDRDLLNPPFHVRFARNEPFTGIGMDKPLLLTEKMLILTDEKQVLCVYPYRDSDKTKITNETRNALVVGYGTPRVTDKQLKGAVKTTVKYIRDVAGGKVELVKVFGRRIDA